MSQNPLTLTRQSLYELVWARPMVDVAKDFNMSDVALAKRCRSVDVPVPPRGWWARLAAGQKPHRTPLPKYRTRGAGSDAAPAAPPPLPPKEILREGPEPQVRFGPRPPRPDAVAPPPRPAAELPLRSRVDAVSHEVATDLDDVTGVIKRTAVELGAARVKDFKWGTDERRGPIISITASETARLRALRIADAIIRSAAEVGWPFEADAPEKPESRSRWAPVEPERLRVGHFKVEGEPLRIRIDERSRQVVHVLTERERAELRRAQSSYHPKWDSQPTGDLRVHLTTLEGRAFKTVKETARNRLEGQVLGILHDLLDRALLEKQWREDRRLAEEQARERQRLECLASERRDAHRKLIARLERQAGAWYRARLLRAYIRAARRAVGDQPLRATLQEVPVDFLAWAADYVEQLDPLTRRAPHPDQATSRPYYYGADESLMKSTLFRLAGLDSDGTKVLGVADVRGEDDPDDLEEDDD